MINIMLHLNQTKKTFFMIAIILTCLLIDLGQFFLAGTLLIPLLLSFFCVMIMHQEYYTSSLMIIAFLQCLETFCFYNLFYLACLQLIPITALAIFFKKNLYPARFQSIMLAGIGIIIQIYAIEDHFLHVWSTNYYTIMRIAGMLLIAICFSLTINIWGVQDNRAQNPR